MGVPGSRSFHGLVMRVVSLAAVALLLVPLPTSAATPRPMRAAAVPSAPVAGRSWIVVYRPGVLSTSGDASGMLRLDTAAGRAAARALALASDHATDRLASAGGFRVTDHYRYALQGFSARLTKAQVETLLDDPAVARVVPDVPVTVQADTWPPGVRRVTGSAGTTGEPGSTADTDIDVAVIDTGIGPVGGPTGAGAELDIAGGTDCRTRRTGSWSDGHGHGTHVAGTIGARDNGVGVVGVAPGARLWSVRVFDSSGSGSTASVICGIDWVASWMAQHPGQPMVANMSLRGDDAYRGPTHCDANGRDARDPEHQAICAATGAGAVFVVAAGNESADTDDTIPARYDEVITVAAISDYDGAPGGLSSAKTIANCVPPSGTARDDAFAPYSNYGAAVDVVAPGTCIRSLAPGTGPTVRTAIMSGTSMATPHVTGAIARYLADHPGTSPAVARAQVIASGSLAWATASDPYHRAHPRSPLLRLIDGAALDAGAPAVTVWPGASTLTVGAGGRQVSVPFELQRAGGLDGPVDLTLGALPDGVSLTDPNALSELTGLRGTLGLAITDSVTDGDHPIAISSGSGSPATVVLRVDRLGPVISTPWPRVTIRAGAAYAGSAPIRVAWSVQDVPSGLARVELQRRGSAWRQVRSGTALQAASSDLETGVTTAFRVRATDRAGNVTTSPPVNARLEVRDSRSGDVHWTGAWRTRTSTSALGRSLRTAARAGATATLQFTGRGVAIIAPRGPDRGSLGISIDGTSVGQVRLDGSSASKRIVYASGPLPDGDHVITVTARSKGSSVDGFLILR